MRTLALCAILTTFGNAAAAQTGLTYRFQSDTLVGRVWVAGESARRELEAGEGGTAAGRVEIWKDSGRQIFVLNPADQTYYEENAFLARRGLHRVSLEPLTVRRPLRVESVGNVRVDLELQPRSQELSGHICRKGVLRFSYGLGLSLEGANVNMPGRVEGSQDFCVLEGETVALPFGHRLEVTTGHPQVDTAIAERLAGLTGMPVARVLKATRWIERGEPASGASALMLSEIRTVAIAADRFEVPKEYRFQEPEIVPPGRRHP
jgi:hypothetical protein